MSLLKFNRILQEVDYRSPQEMSGLLKFTTVYVHGMTQSKGYWERFLMASNTVAQQ